MTRPQTAPAPVSRNCATGNHKRCLGTVLIYPPDGGKHIVACNCPDCRHPAGDDG